jgi:hypothetical protein
MAPQRQQSVFLSIDCATTCHKAKEQKFSVSRNFSIDELNLFAGDGGLWASTTSSMELLSQETCLAKSIEQCEGAENIEELKDILSTTSPPPIKDKKVDNKKKPQSWRNVWCQSWFFS